MRWGLQILSLKQRLDFNSFWVKFGLAGLFFALLATLLLRQSLLPSHTLLPLDLIHTIEPWRDDGQVALQNPLISDPFYSFYPRRVLLTTEIRSGRLPLWNPTIMSGTSNVANPNFQLFYPINLLAALVLPADQALPWLAWIHLVLTGVLMYLFLQRYHLKWYAAVLGAGVWMLNGYTLVWLENPHRLSTLAWLPGVFWALDSAIQKERLGWAAAGGLMLGIAILGGQMQFVFGIGLLLSFYGLLLVVNRFWKTRRVPWRIILYLGVIAIIGLGIGSLSILPAWEFAATSQRAHISADAIIRSGWPISQLVTLVAPDFYGNPIRTPYWGLSNYAETCAYMGVVTLVLALTAPLMARSRVLFRRAGYLAVFVLALVLGSPVARLLTWLPGGEFMTLSRMLFLIPFVGALLAAVALDGWLWEAASGRSWAALAIAVGIAGLITLYTGFHLGEAAFVQHGASIQPSIRRAAAIVTVLVLLLATLRSRPRLLGTLIVLLAVGDLLQWGWSFNPISPISELYPVNPVVDYLQQEMDEHERVLALQTDQVVFGPNVLSLYGFSSIGGYTPLITDYYYDLFKSIDDQVDIWWMVSNRNMLVMSNFDPLVSLLNVKYVLSARRLGFDIIPQTSTEGCQQEIPVGDSLLTQEFTVQDPGLNRVDVYLRKNVTDDDAQIEFWLWRDRPQGDLVAYASVPGEAIPDEGYSPFFFEPVPDSAGETFVLGVSSGYEGFSVCQTAGGQLDYAAFATWLQERGEFDGVWIYENPNAAPRAFMVHHVKTVSEEQVLQTLHSPDLNWYHSAVMATSLPQEQAQQLAETPVQSQALVQIQQYHSQAVDILVDTPQAGILILGDSYYPGWEATVDGQNTPVYRVDQALRGIFVPSGTHQIQFRFRPASFRIAVWISICCVLAASVLLWSGSRPGRNSGFMKR